MDLRIKNLKSKKKKKADKKTLEQRMALLSDEKQQTVKLVVRYRDLNTFNGDSCCCPGYTRLEAFSFWPPFFTDEKTKE